MLNSDVIREKTRKNLIYDVITEHYYVILKLSEPKLKMVLGAILQGCHLRDLRFSLPFDSDKSAHSKM